MTGIVDDLDYNRKGPSDSYETCSSAPLFFSSYKLCAETRADRRSGNGNGEQRRPPGSVDSTVKGASGVQGKAKGDEPNLEMPERPAPERTSAGIALISRIDQRSEESP